MPQAQKVKNSTSDTIRCVICGERFQIIHLNIHDQPRTYLIVVNFGNAQGTILQKNFQSRCHHQLLSITLFGASSKVIARTSHAGLIPFSAPKRVSNPTLCRIAVILRDT